MSSSDNSNQPGLVASHAQYIKGAAVEGVGNLTGAQDWKQSGAEQKEHAVQEMKAASEHRDPAKDGYGKPEEVAGKLTGCEGMIKEGQASERKQ